MSRYTAEVFWERGDQPFLDNRYSRKHQLRFDGGAAVPGSSSPLHERCYIANSVQCELRCEPIDHVAN
jgi:hypothetical protein